MKNYYPKYPILLVDDEDDILETYKNTLRSHGFNNFIFCNDSREVASIVDKNHISMIILDLLMPYLSGREILLKLKENNPHIPVIVVTGSTSIDTAVKCMQNGASDYIVKPIEESRFISSIKKCTEIYDLEDELNLLRQTMLSREIKNPKAFISIVTINDSLKSIFRYIEAIAESSKSVLITGESGVGKELIAKAIHSLSKRDGNFVSVNIAGLEENVFTDTLFGHKKGAFTGAEKDRKGLIEEAHGGTLFLDEIGDININSQMKLFRLLQEREYYKIGSDIKRTSFARIITATSLDLQSKCNDGSFRQELYYRLNSHHIHIPPLRERTEDIPILIDHFVKSACEQMNKEIPLIPGHVYEMLGNYHFPGNIRELQNIITNAVSFIDESNILPHFTIEEYLQKQNFSANPDSNKTPSVLKVVTNTGQLPTIKCVEKFLIISALKKTNGKQAEAAQILGMSQPTMSRRMNELSIHIE